MIARVWRGVVHQGRMGDYRAHLQQSVFPELARIDGFVGAYVLQRDVDDGIEIVVETLWKSMEAIGQFAGAEVERAVVDAAAEPLFQRYEATVTHFQAESFLVNVL